MLVDGFVDRLMLTGKPVKSSLCVSQLRKRCVALCFKKLLEL